MKRTRMLMTTMMRTMIMLQSIQGRKSICCQRARRGQIILQITIDWICVSRPNPRMFMPNIFSSDRKSWSEIGYFIFSDFQICDMITKLILTSAKGPHLALFDPKVWLKYSQNFWIPCNNDFASRCQTIKFYSTPLASKVRCSISVLENSSSSVIFQSPTPLRVQGGCKRGAPPKPGGAAPVQRRCTPQSQGVQHLCQGVHPLAALKNIALTKVHP